jgi:hypothetical protein
VRAHTDRSALSQAPAFAQRRLDEGWVRKLHAGVLHDMVESKKLHLLVFVIAYQAQSTLARVLRSVPSAVFQDYDIEIIVQLSKAESPDPSWIKSSAL